MTHLQKLRIGPVLKWGFPTSRITGSIHASTQYPRFYGNKHEVETSKRPNDCAGRKSLAEATLKEYLYSTRSMRYTHAEILSKNSPNFVKKLLKKIENEEDVARALRFFFHYHPINEFEPFFESLGLEPSKHAALLPRNMIFLSDDALLVENYQILCNYGVAPTNIGKIYLEAKEVSRYDYGVLQSKLLAYEKLGLCQSTVAQIIVYCPALLIGDANADFVKVLDELTSLGIEFSWMEKHLSDNTSCNWGQILELLCVFNRIFGSKEQLGGLISQHSRFLSEGSGHWTLLLIGFLLKLGCTMNQLYLLFLQFPQIQVKKFVSNLRHSVLFLISVEMDSKDIQNMVCSHPLMLGSIQLKSSSKLLYWLKVSKRQFCRYIKENPVEMKNWVIRNPKPEPLPKSEEEKIAMRQKAKFLSDLGFENSEGMFQKTELRDLQERFDTIVKAGLDPKDVAQMVKTHPVLLNKSKGEIQRKIDFLVNGLGYPISTLLACPLCLRLSIERIKLRMSFFNWLKDRGAVNDMLAMSTCLCMADEKFIKQYVIRHPRGLEVWENMKKQIVLK